MLLGHGKIDSLTKYIVVWLCEAYEVFTFCQALDYVYCCHRCAACNMYIQVVGQKHNDMCIHLNKET